MAWSGMDVDAVESFAKGLDSDAEALDSIVTRLETQVRRLRTTWQGTDLEQFAGEWSARQRPALNAVEQELRHLADVARSNVAAQRDASAAQAGGASGGGTALPPWLMDPRGIARIPEEGMPDFHFDAWFASLAPSGSGTDGFASWIGRHTDWTVPGTRINLSDWISAGVDAVGSAFPWFKSIQGIYSGAIAGSQVVSGDPQKILDGWVSVGSGLLKSLGEVTPVGYWGGVAVGAVGMAADAAAQADWSASTFRNNVDYVRQHPEVVLQSAGDAFVQLTPKIVGLLAEFKSRFIP